MSPFQKPFFLSSVGRYIVSKTDWFFFSFGVPVCSKCDGELVRSLASFVFTIYGASPCSNQLDGHTAFFVLGGFYYPDTYRQTRHCFTAARLWLALTSCNAWCVWMVLCISASGTLLRHHKRRHMWLSLLVVNQKMIRTLSFESVPR